LSSSRRALLFHTIGSGDDSRDWNRAAEVLGNHILSQCPRWLIMVQGTGDQDPAANPGRMKMQAPEWHFWGENLQGAKDMPVVLNDATKLVYSPHVYGPSKDALSYFRPADFTRSMPGIWEKHFGFVTEPPLGTPIVIGELGGFYRAPKDIEWQDWALGYAAQRHMGVFYFGLNPNSDDTGGLLDADWTTLIPEKVASLRQLPSTSLCALRGVARYWPPVARCTPPTAAVAALPSLDVLALPPPAQLQSAERLPKGGSLPPPPPEPPPRRRRQ
jgi:aryl-phospho-beta-D-glucosidase BglC (GH1 family)